MLKSLRFFCVFIACFAIPLAAQLSANTNTKPDYSKEASIIEKTSTRLVLENDGTGIREAMVRVRMQSDAGVQNYGLLVFSYQSSSETMDIDYVRVHKPDGTVVATPLESIQDMAAEISRQAPLYSDQHEKHVAVKGLGVNDVLEYQIRWRSTKPLIPGQFWYAYNFAHDDIVLDEQLQISVPRDRAVKWKSPEVKPAITEEGARRVFTWAASNPERKTTEQEEKETESRQYQAVRGLFPPPEVQFSTFQSWEEIGRWYGSLQQERVKPSPEVSAKAAELTKGQADEDAKIRAIYNYVSTQYRYIGIAFGIGRFQPHSAAEVLSNRYGDCKDKHTLLAALLRAVGITAYPALVSSINDLDPEMPSISQFNHVITAVPRGKHWLWLDSTSELAAFEHLVPPVRNKQALVIPVDGAPMFVTTPADPPFQSSSVFKADGKLSQAGVLDARMEQSLRGDLEVLTRTVFRRVPQSQWKELIQRISYGSGFGGTVSEVVASSPEATDAPFHFSYAYNRKDYSDWENRRITPPFPPMLLPSLRNDQTNFRLPLWLGTPGENVLQATIKMPQGYTPELPQTVDIKRDFADYHASYDLEKGVLTAERRLVIKLREVPLAEFAEYKSFRKAVEDDQERYIVLAEASSSPDPRSGPFAGNAALDLPDSDNLDAMRAEGLAREAVQRQDMTGAIGSLRRAVEADPKFLRDWILLGQLYTASRKTDLALDAFHKGVDADPQSPFPRRILAFGFMAANRPDDAIKAWQELLKITPEDSDAVYSLGIVLLSQKRYADAIPALESSAKANPESIPRLMSLGSAYLRSGNQEKGVAAFESALKLKPGPQAENDFGYELADTNIRLSDALQHAQKAVQAEEDASSKVMLHKLEADDLVHTRDLSAFWDTLGWVYFRMANLSRAEQYLSASFDLSQNSTVADHLGQVYEQEHKTEAAIRMYHLALSASSNLPETQERLNRLNHGAIRPQNPFSGGAELSQLRTTKLSRIVPGTASAEFFLLFGPGSKLEEVKFIKGSEKLRTAGKILSSTHFKVPFPDDSAALLVRRGILGCYPTTGCALVLLLPQTVRSVD